MRRLDYDIRSLLDIPEWEKVQDQLAALTGTAIITIDYKGKPVSKHSARTEFCTVIRENAISAKRCYKCDSLAGLEAVRLEKPFIYLCHCGIVDVAVPVMAGDRYLGAVMFGQVRIPSDDTNAKVERLVMEISSFNEGADRGSADLLDMYNRLPELEYKKIEEIASMIDSMVKYIVKRALRYRADKLALEYKARNTAPPNFDGRGNDASHRFEEVRSLKNPPLKGIYSAGVSEIHLASPVYPALSYIQNHPHEIVAMKEMAKLCHLSASYFSRLFKKEVGENFNEYINRNKTEMAKNALTTTNHSISDIAEGLGFQDTSYFVKVFKRYEGITPSDFRKLRVNV